jgi:methyl-accepting chemotaxis protein
MRSEGEGLSTSNTGQARITWSAPLAGAASGLALGLLATLLFITGSRWAFVAFFVVAAAAGAALGALCDVRAARLVRRRLSGVLDVARDQLGLRVDETDGAEGLAAEVERVFGEAAGALQHLRVANTEIRSLTEQVLAATEEQASGAVQQAAAVTQTSATVEELAQTSKQIADNSTAVAKIAELTLSSAEEGMRALDDTDGGIDEIRESTQLASDRILELSDRGQEIGRVLVIIDDIAEQTKILALNAAIEAARAGEAGRGFAVVAEEIRKLAESVTQSTQEISRVVHEIQANSSSLVMTTEKASKKVEEGKLLARRTAEALERIVAQVEETTDSAKQISIATQQQRSASDQVVVSMREMAQVSTQAATTSRQIESAMSELNQLADSLAQ